MSSPEITADALAITLFGPMQVWVQGSLLPPLRSRKALWALALLTLRHNRPVEREWLAATLWPDLEQSQAFANLRPVLSELRRALGEEGARLQSPDRQTLLLELSGAEVDVLAFDAAIKKGNLADLEQAVALYGGPLLEGCQEEWAGQERASREQKCLQALQKLGEAALMAGNYAEAVNYFQKASGLDAWSDASRRGWMVALAKNGDRNAALQVYREFLNILRSDPNAVPDEKTTALYQRLRMEARQQASTPAAVKAEVAAIPRITGYLPHALTDLVGREDERLEVAERLRRSRLVTLTGMGGIGKTRLAMEVAKEVLREYPDSVWLIALEALSEDKMVAQQIASVLGLKEESGRNLLQSLNETLRGKRLLLVLDNCEHLLEASAQAAAYLLQECADVHILATSREALGIMGETAWAVPCLAVPDPAHLPQAWATLNRVLMGYESVQLFVERAQTAARAKALNGAGALAYDQGEYAAANALFLESLNILRDLGDRRGVAVVLNNQGNVAHDQGDYASAQALYEESLHIHKELGDKSGIALVLGNLGNVARPQGDLPLAKAFYEESLELYRELGDRRNIPLTLERVGLVAYVQGDYTSAWTLHEESLTLRREFGNRRAIAWSLCNLGEVAHAQGNHSKAQYLFEESLTIFKEFGDRRGVAMALGNLGSVCYYTGEYSAARRLLQESVKIFRELQDQRSTAQSLTKLGNLAYTHEEYNSSRRLHEESLGIYAVLGDRRGIAESLEGLASVMLAQARARKAVRLWGAANALRAKLGIPRLTIERARIDGQVSEAQLAMNEDAFASDWAMGLALTWEQAVAYALSEGDVNTV